MMAKPWQPLLARQSAAHSCSESEPCRLSTSQSRLLAWRENCASVGSAVGEAVGTTGSTVGEPVGCGVGLAVGAEVVGGWVGVPLGDVVGVAVGAGDGLAVGVAVGAPVGDVVGEEIGLVVGAEVGAAVGAVVGDAVLHTLVWKNAAAPSTDAGVGSQHESLDRKQLSEKVENDWQVGSAAQTAEHSVADTPLASTISGQKDSMLWRSKPVASAVGASVGTVVGTGVGEVVGEVVGTDRPIGEGIRKLSTHVHHKSQQHRYDITTSPSPTTLLGNEKGLRAGNDGGDRAALQGGGEAAAVEDAIGQAGGQGAAESRTAAGRHGRPRRQQRAEARA